MGAPLSYESYVSARQTASVSNLPLLPTCVQLPIDQFHPLRHLLSFPSPLLFYLSRRSFSYPRCPSLPYHDIHLHPFPMAQAHGPLRHKPQSLIESHIPLMRTLQVGG